MSKDKAPLEPANPVISQYIHNEAFAGIVLIFASACAFAIANSPWLYLYQGLIESNFSIGFNDLKLSKPILHWVNDGLMAIYFMLIGLELKREMLNGELSKPSQILLPGAAALGGIIVPAFIFYAFNSQHSLSLKGWAIPTATDIAFSLGILALLGKRIPSSLKIFLMTIAIFDDFAAILIIAIFYTGNLSTLSLTLASIAIALLILCNYLNVKALSVYFFIGTLLWFFVLKSGVHATLAGVILAFIIPNTIKGEAISPLHTIEYKLQPWVSFFIIPLFAFTNSGINFKDISLNDFLNPLTLGITLGLFLGKQIGIFGTTFLLVKLKMATLPQKTNWRHIYGVAVLAGIGFTMSLFISSLAFEHYHRDFTILSRIGILGGSLVSAILGYFILKTNSLYREYPPKMNLS
ncbi:MAG: Na+/H+ antiporter NhaA [Proteobacteria bacterium]|nr:Na+/H+ antiporter NhaA [Pseudomonadota bacterium]